MSKLKIPSPEQYIEILNACTEGDCSKLLTSLSQYRVSYVRARQAVEHCCANNQEDTLLTLLKHPHIYQTDNLADYALTKAIYYNRLSLSTNLITKAGNIEVSSVHAEKALEIGNPDILKLLARKGADFSAHLYDMDTIAVSYKDTDHVVAIIDSLDKTEINLLSFLYELLFVSLRCTTHTPLTLMSKMKSWHKPYIIPYII